MGWKLVVVFGNRYGSGSRLRFNEGKGRNEILVMSIGMDMGGDELKLDMERK